jgi:hypothetical protein
MFPVSNPSQLGASATLQSKGKDKELDPMDIDDLAESVFTNNRLNRCPKEIQETECNLTSIQKLRQGILKAKHKSALLLVTQISD